jgi:ribosomal protein L22
MADEKQKKQEKQDKPRKDTAIVNGTNLGISTKDASAICKMIRGKGTEKALDMLNEVLAYKRVVKMNKREVGHKKGKGVMAGRYPINAVREFIRLLRQLNANAVVNELPLEEYVIFCKADKASRPYRRGGTQFKRTHVLLKLEKKKEKKK